MKNYEVIVTQVSNNRARVVHKDFDGFDAARQYAHDICVDDKRTVSCSIYKGIVLVMDVL